MRSLPLSIENSPQHLSCLHMVWGLDHLPEAPRAADPPTLPWVLGSISSAGSILPPQLSWLAPWCCVRFVPCRDPFTLPPEHAPMSFSFSKTHKGLEMPRDPHVSSGWNASADLQLLFNGF